MRNIAEGGYLLTNRVGYRKVAPAKDSVWLDADSPQLFDAVLGGLGLQLLGGGQVRKQGQVDIVNVVAADVVSDLANGLQEGKSFNVSHRAAHFHHHYIDVVGFG